MAEDAIIDWTRQAAAPDDVRTLGDQAVLTLCDLAMSESDQRELSEHLTEQREGTLQPNAEQREGTLQPNAARRLDELLEAYRRGLTVKALAIREAVARGLRPRLDETGA